MSDWLYFVEIWKVLNRIGEFITSQQKMNEELEDRLKALESESSFDESEFTA